MTAVNALGEFNEMREVNFIENKLMSLTTEKQRTDPLTSVGRALFVISSTLGVEVMVLETRP